MRPERVLRFLVLNGVAAGLGAVIATSCADVSYGVVAFRCNPRQGAQACPEEYFCCSDDPAAIGGALPDYTGRNIPGSDDPLFSGSQNAFSSSGMCVDLGAIQGDPGYNPAYVLQDPGAVNCPIPCNPRWSQQQVTQVCGAGAQCCQTVLIEPEDCVHGLDEVWRPAVGADIRQTNVFPSTSWSPFSHATHQAPNGAACRELFPDNQDAFEDCLRQLTVADQRGFCRWPQTPDQRCPAQNEFADACEQINQGLIPPPN